MKESAFTGSKKPTNTPTERAWISQSKNNKKTKTFSWSTEKVEVWLIFKTISLKINKFYNLSSHSAGISELNFEKIVLKSFIFFFGFLKLFLFI